MGSIQQDVDVEFAMRTRTSPSANSSKASIRVGARNCRDAIHLTVIQDITLVKLFAQSADFCTKYFPMSFASADLSV